MIRSDLTSSKEIDLIIIIRQLENVLLAQKKEATNLLSSILVFLITLSWWSSLYFNLNALVLYKCVRKTGIWTLPVFFIIHSINSVNHCSIVIIEVFSNICVRVCLGIRPQREPRKSSWCRMVYSATTVYSYILNRTANCGFL